MITDQDKQFMRAAIRLADESVERGGGPFGAVIVKDGEIVAGSSNSVTLHNDPTAHAEVETIRQACQRLGTYDLSGCTIYTSCEPCPMCLGAIYWAHIDRIYYGNTRKDARDTCSTTRTHRATAARRGHHHIQDMETENGQDALLDNNEQQLLLNI